MTVVRTIPKFGPLLSLVTASLHLREGLSPWSNTSGARE